MPVLASSANHEPSLFPVGSAFETLICIELTQMRTKDPESRQAGGKNGNPETVWKQGFTPIVAFTEFNQFIPFCLDLAAAQFHCFGAKTTLKAHIFFERKNLVKLVKSEIQHL